MYVIICLNEVSWTCWRQGRLLFLALCEGVVGIKVPDTKHLAMRRMIYYTEELISNEGGNLEGEGRR